MSGHLSKEGQELHDRILKAGGVGSANDVFENPIPKIVIWKIISAAAPSQEREPFHEAVKQFMLSGHWGKYGTLWPGTLYETANDLPGISREENLAICRQFLLAEQRSGRLGNLIYLLHWDVLAAYYCPLRERYSVLRDMVKQGLLAEASSGQGDTRSQLKWPLMITEAGRHDVKKALWRYRLRFNFLFGIETVLDGLWQNYPRIITFLAAGLGAGILIKLAEWWFK